MVKPLAAGLLLLCVVIGYHYSGFRVALCLECYHHGLVSVAMDHARSNMATTRIKRLYVEYGRRDINNQVMTTAPIVLTHPDSKFWHDYKSGESPKARNTRIVLTGGCEFLFTPNCAWALISAVLAETSATQLPATGSRFRDPLTSGGHGPEMVVLPIGTFVTHYDSTDRRRQVVHQALAASRHEVTVAQFRRYARATDNRIKTGCWYHTSDQQWLEADSASWQDPPYAQTDNHPVTCLNWEDVMDYVTWLSGETGQHYRLPSETEFEFLNQLSVVNISSAFSSDGATLCQYGNGADKRSELEYAHGCDDGFQFAAPVGSYPTNVFGLQDTLGNLWEFTGDCWNPQRRPTWRTLFRAPPLDGTPWLIGNCNLHVIKGGAFLSSVANLRRTAREYDGGTLRTYRVGIRLIREL